MRLIHAVDVASAPTTGAHLKFDPSRIYFKGHSQGGLTGPLFLAAEPEVKAAILSGAGGGLIESLLNKTEPVNIPQVVQALLHDPADQYHPLLSLCRATSKTPTRSTTGGSSSSSRRRASRAKSIFQTLGIVDHYTPIPNIETLALGMGVQPAGPHAATDRRPRVHHDAVGNRRRSPAMSLVGRPPECCSNIRRPPGHDGHFVVFDVPDAIAQSNRFLGTAAATGAARLDPP